MGRGRFGPGVLRLTLGRALVLSIALVAATPYPAAARSHPRTFDVATVVLTATGRPVSDLLTLHRYARETIERFPPYWSAATGAYSTLVFDPWVDEMGDSGIVNAAGFVDPPAFMTAFYASHRDAYDFILIWQAVAPTAPVAGVHTSVQFDVTGHGDPLPGVEPEFPPPAGVARLLGLNTIRIEPTSDGPRATESTFPTLLHEFAHQWCCEAYVPPGLGYTGDMLSTPGHHWTDWLYVPPRPLFVMGDHSLFDLGWNDNGDGTYTHPCLSPASVFMPDDWRFPRWQLFLMGLIDAEDADDPEVLVPDDGRASPWPCGTRIAARRVRIPMATFIDWNGYSSVVPLVRASATTTTGPNSVLWAQDVPLRLRVGETAWTWVAFRNVGTWMWSRHLIGLAAVEDTSAFLAGVEVVGFDGGLVGRMGESQVRSGGIANFGIQLRGRAAGDYSIGVLPKLFNYGYTQVTPVTVRVTVEP